MHNTRRSFNSFSHIITTIALLGVEGDIKDKSNSGCFLDCLFHLPHALVCSHISQAGGSFVCTGSCATSIHEISRTEKFEA